MKNKEEAEDILVSGMYKIMTKINQYSGDGSFEGWMRRIIVNEALMAIRKKHNFNTSLDDTYLEPVHDDFTESSLAAADILKMVEELPTGYKTVFNLYVIEGYKHKEIAEILGISINTSKSQLILAKKKLRGMMKRQDYPDSRLGNL